MNDSSPPLRRSTNGGLRAFDAVLWVLSALLVLVSAITVPLFFVVLAGHGSITLPATLDPPYSIRSADHRSVTVTGHGLEFVDPPRVQEEEPPFEAPTLHVKTKVLHDDVDSRIVVLGAFVAFLGLTWLGLVNLRRIVRSARAGEPFAAHNVARLRLLAVAVLVFPAVAIVMTRVLNRTLDARVPLHVATPVPAWWMFVTVGIGVLALAEVFREGAELQELEQGTI